MRLHIRNYNELGAGAIYLLFGVSALWFGRDYPMGTGARMGPGYFPIILGVLLSGFGFIALARALILENITIPTFAFRQLILVTGSIVLFAVLLQYVGVVVALITLMLVGASASSRFRLHWRYVLGILVFVAICTVVFVYALGVPIPLAGTLFMDR
ncbi:MULTISPECIES: tripartite tricarboxylate transporter TctB family protein [unclassified Rhizobium]|uniref:tripartite tricarboxylate transporter TctB family protein n=1 Tax=unclassified Rhizobium TaxID=2613769 RepID=UPI000BD701B6|nr:MULTISPECIES: tripartite tricarboxylate transporter TctB family protein [unclassified Rhizobium]MDH7809506.1 glucan phosphoethanolaminetransferase (alkaline phosphatase superfamily) [Rhizobium sp. AN67]MDQ4408754.1 tripartite tricarboxylate transporter TctB family protein [Rhizobium sp. AN63]SOD50425.1 Tripartite tricarboxylate transporter TctB family protein [Rhizobium sp. AN6A]